MQGFEQAVVESELIRHVALKANRAVYGVAGREEEVVMVVEINDCPDVEGGADIGEIRFV